jgi:TPR repeat protein
MANRRGYRRHRALELTRAAVIGGSCWGHIEAAPAAVESHAANQAANCICLVGAPDAPNSLNHLRISYAKGKQGKRNPRLAMRFPIRSAMRGYTPAMANLGTL